MAQQFAVSHCPATNHCGKTIIYLEFRTHYSKDTPVKNSQKMLLIGCIAMLLACGGTRQQSPQIIRIKGSDTMLLLSEKWAQAFMVAHTGVSVYVSGGGTATGIQALIRGDVEISTASRPINTVEVQQLAEEFQKIGLAVLVARDALSVYLHPENPVSDLTLKQLKEIFSGDIRNWREVGGNDAPIEVICRPKSSGTYAYFREHILENREYSTDALVLQTTGEIVERIRNHPNAIGYGGLGYGQDLRHCRVNSIPATHSSVQYDLYPISRYLYFYTVDKPRGVTRQFIDWVQSEAGQQIVEESGYIPLWEIK